MRTLIASLIALMALSSSAEVLELVAGSSRTVGGGQLAHVEAISTVADGSVSIVEEMTWYTNGVEVVALPPVTNTTYELVYMDGSTVVTNVTTEPVDFKYIGTNYVSYATNTVVITDYATNTVSLLALAVTNTVDSLTCESGIGAKSPSDKWLAPSAKVWFTGTAKGRVWVYIK